MSADDEGVGPAAAAVVDALLAAGIPCALGGALALGVWGVPRGTTDVDLDVFVGEERYEEVLDVLAGAGCTFDRDVALKQAREGDTVVVRFGPWRVDVFVPTIPFYEEAHRRVRMATFRGRPRPFLDAESLAVFKLLFYRAKDLLDLERLVAVAGADLDHTFVREQIAGMMGEDDPRVRDWDAIVARHA